MIMIIIMIIVSGHVAEAKGDVEREVVRGGRRRWAAFIIMIKKSDNTDKPIHYYY